MDGHVDGKRVARDVTHSIFGRDITCLLSYHDSKLDCRQVSPSERRRCVVQVLTLMVSLYAFGDLNPAP